MPRINAANLHDHRRDTRERLLDAWATLSNTHGYEAVTLADVAADAGLARSAIYRYFADKEDLLLAYTDREVARFLAMVHDVFEGTSTNFERLIAYIRLQLADFATRPPPPGRELVAVLPPDAYQRLLRHIDPLEQIVRDLVAAGVAGGEFLELEPDATARSIIGCVGAERRPLGSGAHDLDATTERVTAFLGRALGVTTSPPRRRSRPVRRGRDGA